MRNLSWYLSLAITFAGFTIINHFFTLEKGEKLGNLNPAFIPIVILAPFLLLSLFITIHIGANYFSGATLGKIALAFLVVVFIFVLAGASEYSLIKEQLASFGGTWNNQNSIIYSLSPFNSYTNNWYFNESVFLILHALAFMIGIFIKKTPIEQEEEANT